MNAEKPMSREAREAIAALVAAIEADVAANKSGSPDREATALKVAAAKAALIKAMKQEAISG